MSGKTAWSSMDLSGPRSGLSFTGCVRRIAGSLRYRLCTRKVCTTAPCRRDRLEAPSASRSGPHRRRRIEMIRTRSVAACALAGVLGWLALGLVPKPMLVNRAGFSRAVYDRDGHLLRLTLSSDEK